jgi:6-phosphogluconolactonase
MLETLATGIVYSGMTIIRCRMLMLLLAGVSPLFGEPVATTQSLVFFGTYTGGKSQGIYVSRCDGATGKLSAPELAVATGSPSFLAIHPSHRFLYAVGVLAGSRTGAVSAFAMDASSGKLTLLNQQPSGGTGPCYVGLDNAGKNVLVANYGSGSVATFPIKADGSIGQATTVVQHTGASVNPQRQTGPHAHSIFLDAANRFAFAPDLGIDKIMIYRFDAASGVLKPNEPPFTAVAPGSGPRHFAFHPGGRFAYVINELSCTATAFRYDAGRGALTELQTISTLPPGERVRPDYTAAEVRVHPSGRFLYGSNRGHNTIAVFAIDAATGKLTHIENQPTLGKTPRNFNLDPTGAFMLVANQDSDSVVVFRVDVETGRLTPTGQTIEVGSPVCVKFLPVK